MVSHNQHLPNDVADGKQLPRFITDIEQLLLDRWCHGVSTQTAHQHTLAVRAAYALS